MTGLPYSHVQALPENVYAVLLDSLLHRTQQEAF